MQMAVKILEDHLNPELHSPSPQNDARIEVLRNLLAEIKPAPTGFALPVMYMSAPQTSENDKGADCLIYRAEAELVLKLQAKKEEYQNVVAEKEAAQEKVIALVTAKADRLGKENAKLTAVVNRAAVAISSLT